MLLRCRKAIIIATKQANTSSGHCAPNTGQLLATPIATYATGNTPAATMLAMLTIRVRQKMIAQTTPAAAPASV